MSTQTTAVSTFGPSNRESFFEAQQRNRRATWRLSALCIGAAIIMGIPLALTVTPLLYAVALITADIVNLFSPLPPVFWRQAEQLARTGLVALSWATQHAPANPQVLALGAAVMLLPGAALSIVLWLGMNALFKHAGVGGALLALKAREPNQADLKELRLADVVQEMAIAAGLPAPRVMLIDAPGANAAAIGNSPSDARIVVSRRLLDELTRDELEGALAHLIASVGNGDLRIAFRVTSIFETCGLLVALINSPFGPESRRTLWRIIRYGLGGNARSGGAQEADAVADILTRSVDLDTDDIDRMFDTSTKKKSMFRSIRNFLLVPIFFTNFAIKLSLWFFTWALLGPSVALLWRTRLYLADASAVQLTRNPDGLAGALRKLNDDRGEIPGGAWASHLFLVSPSRADRSSSDGASARQRATLAKAWLESQQAGGTQTQGSTLAVPQGSDLSAMIKEAAATQRAALAGDAQAIARIQAFTQKMSKADPVLAAEIPAITAQLPALADVAAARQGDPAAMARLRTLALSRQAANRSDAGKTKAAAQQSSPGASTSFIGFHPSLKRRMKRLERMGSHVQLDADAEAAAKFKLWIVAAVFGVILAPLLLLTVALFLLLIAIMTMASLAFLVVWLAVIHKIFAIVAHH